MWQWVQAFCAMYVFVGILVFYLATLTGKSWFMLVASVAWVLNFWLLWYANKKW